MLIQVTTPNFIQFYPSPHNMLKILSPILTCFFRYENTLNAYRNAILQGTQMLELDVQLSKVISALNRIRNTVGPSLKSFKYI